MHVTKLLVEFGTRKLFLVADKQAYLASGAKRCLDGILEDYRVYQFCDFSINPKVEDVDRGISMFQTERFDTVLAVGGGSSIDMAKLINFLSGHPKSFENYKFKSKASGDSVRPLIAIPTTSGSGSETTHFAVIYVGKEKQSVSDPCILPTVAIVDAGLTMSFPPQQTAISRMDALSQAIESLWSIYSTEESSGYAVKAIELITSNIDSAVNNPATQNRVAMAEGSHLAGKAINITKTTAAHSVSYPLSGWRLARMATARRVAHAGDPESREVCRCPRLAAILRPIPHYREAPTSSPTSPSVRR